MDDTLRRSGRTGQQSGFIGAVVILLGVFDIISWTEVQTGAVMAVAIPAIAFIQNWYEKRTNSSIGIPK